MGLLPLVGARQAMDGAAAAPGAAGAEELGGAAAGGAGAGAAAGWHHPPFVGDDTAAEVSGVQLDAPDGFVDGAQLGQRKGGADEGGGDARDFELDADALDRVAHDAPVVE